MRASTTPTMPWYHSSPDLALLPAKLGVPSFDDCPPTDGQDAEYDPFEPFVPNAAVPRLFVPLRFLKKIVGAVVDDFKKVSEQTDVNLPLMIEGCNETMQQAIMEHLDEDLNFDSLVWGQRMDHSPYRKTVTGGHLWHDRLMIRASPARGSRGQGPQQSLDDKERRQDSCQKKEKQAIHPQ
jgi:hypothetical protein